MKTLPELFLKSSGREFLFKHTRKIDSIINLSIKWQLGRCFQTILPTKNAIPLTITVLGVTGGSKLVQNLDIDIM